MLPRGMHLSVSDFSRRTSESAIGCTPSLLPSFSALEMTPPASFLCSCRQPSASGGNTVESIVWDSIFPWTGCAPPVRQPPAPRPSPRDAGDAAP